MAAEPNAVELAVSRALRDNLERIRNTSDELHQAVSDIISACSSSRPTNALPAMVRAQSSAASLSAILEVLSRFVTAALQPALRSPAEEEIWRVISSAVLAETAAARIPAPETVAPGAPVAPERLAAAPAHPMEENSVAAPERTEPSHSEEGSAIAETAQPDEAVPAPVQESSEPVFADPVFAPPPEVGHYLTEPPPEQVQPEAVPEFNVASLSTEQQELHRRAYRVAKVSMQDIKMLRPEDVRLGRENKDLCSRLRDDIEKAHKEYERRFQSILSHPVDYFYDWMVEILAGGNPEALGEYPYRSAVLHR